MLPLLFASLNRITQAICWEQASSELMLWFLLCFSLNLLSRLVPWRRDLDYTEAQKLNSLFVPPYTRTFISWGLRGMTGGTCVPFNRKTTMSVNAFWTSSICNFLPELLAPVRTFYPSLFFHSIWFNFCTDDFYQLQRAPSKTCWTLKQPLKLMTL